MRNLSVGVNSTGPVWGAIADSRGPKPYVMLEDLELIHKLIGTLGCT